MYGKIVIYCNLKVLTGMHIGGSSTFSAIGAVDSPVIRDPRTQRPILPGSSLKGKLRTLLARSICRDVHNMPECNEDDEVILRMFGASKPIQRSRLQFADSFITNAEQLKDVGLTEVKTENNISRATSAANPRQIERVIAGAVFGVRIVYDVLNPDEVLKDMEYLARAMQLLQLDYLGGHGSRGSGRVGLSDFKFDCLESDFPLEQLNDIFGKVENYGLLPV